MALNTLLKIMEEKIKILIVEDEYPIALDLETRLQDMNFEIAGNAASYQEAITILSEKDINIAILDINLNEEKTGIDIANIINEKFNIPIIFLTSYTDQTNFENSLSSNPMAFINKPFKDSELKHTISLAIKNFQEKKSNSELKMEDNNYFLIRENGKLLKININEILWIKAIDNYSQIKTTKGKFISGSNLRTTLEKINNENIIRIHKSHAIAIDKIDKIENSIVYIKSDLLRISRKYKEDFMKKFKLL